MSEQKLEDKDKEKEEIELESDNYLLNFLDSLYAGIIAFSFTIIYSTLVKPNELVAVNIVERSILFLMAFVFIVADWTGSRALTWDYPYLSKNYFARARVFIDILIGCLYFCLIILASLQSSLYILIFSMVFLLGAGWSYVIRFEYRNYQFYETKIKEDPRLEAIKLTHLILALAWFAIWFVDVLLVEDRWTNTAVFPVVVTSFWLTLILFKGFCWIRLGK